MDVDFQDPEEGDSCNESNSQKSQQFDINVNLAPSEGNFIK